MPTGRSLFYQKLFSAHRLIHRIGLSATEPANPFFIRQASLWVIRQKGYATTFDALQENVDGNARVRIMHLFIGTEQRAILFVQERIHKDTPWYYLWKKKSVSPLAPLVPRKRYRSLISHADRG